MLPLNEQYKTLTGATQPLIRAAQSIGKSLPSKKAVDVSKFQGLTQTVNQYTQQPTSGVTTPKTNLGAVTTPYGGSTKYEKFHPGIDIANKIGTPVQTYAPGKVTDVVTGRKQGDKGYGNYVIVTDTQGNQHRYSHLAQTFVKLGQVVPKGYTFGLMGNTGSTYSTSGGTGSHLDYRVRDIYNKYINPIKFING